MIRNLDFVRRGLGHLNVDVNIKHVEQAIIYESDNKFVRDGETFMARMSFYHNARDLGIGEEGVIELDVVMFLVKDREEGIENGESIYIDYVGIFDMFIAPLEYQELLEKKADEREEVEG